MEKLDEEARLDGRAEGEVEAEQVVTLLLIRVCDDLWAKTRKVCFLKAGEQNGIRGGFGTRKRPVGM